MNNLVTVRKNEDGTFISKTKNPEIGFVIYEQKAVELRNGWYADKSLSALVLGPLALLESMDHSKPLTGKIIVREQLEPFNEKDLTYKLKYAGDSGIVCMQGDSAIYRTTEFTADLNAQSTFIQHTNSAEIREANNSTVAVESLNAFKQETVEA
jgi:hypothetical protein